METLGNDFVAKSGNKNTFVKNVTISAARYITGKNIWTQLNIIWKRLAMI